MLLVGETDELQTSPRLRFPTCKRDKSFLCCEKDDKQRCNRPDTYPPH